MNMVEDYHNAEVEILRFFHIFRSSSDDGHAYEGTKEVSFYVLSSVLLSESGGDL